MVSSSVNNTENITFDKLKDLSTYKNINTNKTLLTRWVFTWNNYTEQDISKLKIFAQKYCKYLIYGYEEAPTTNTKHLQGYIHLLRRLSLSQLKGILGPVPAFYMAKKNDLANYRYCSKSDNFYFYESGLGGTQTESSNYYEKPKRLSTKERMEIAYDLAKEERFNEIDKDLLIKHGKVLKNLKMENLEVEENLYYDQGEKNYFHCHNLWLWGDTGTGKSFFITYFVYGINEWWKEYCEKNNKAYLPLRTFNHQKTKWWCGYMGEEIVIINEVNPVFCSWYANEIKEWVDQYPFNAEVKGSNLGKIRPLFFIFTSNYDLDECFCEMNGRDIKRDPITNEKKYLTEDIKAMHRRMFVIKRTKKDKNTLVKWPNVLDLEEYHDTFETYKNNMKLIKFNYKNDNFTKPLKNKTITIVDETCKTIEKATSSNSSTPKKQKSPKKNKTSSKKNKGKKPADSQNQNENTTSDIFETPKQKYKRQLQIPDKPNKQDIGTCEKCNRPKIYSKVSDGWMCNGCYYYSNDCTCIPLKQLKHLSFDDIEEINDSFITTINDDKVATSTQINSTSILQDDIEEIPSSPLRDKSLERQNAFLHDSNNHIYIGEPPTSLDFCKTPTFDTIESSDDDFIITHEESQSPNQQQSLQIKEDLKKIEQDIQTIQEDLNKSINELADDQETYIPQVDGADDELIDEYNNVFKSKKQKFFIHKQIQLVIEINKYIRKIKMAYHHKQIGEITFIRKLKEYETKKQFYINKYELFKYNYPDNSTYKDIDLCWYCKGGCINQCSCLGEYIPNIPAENFEEKLLWLENRKNIEQLKDINLKLTTTLKEIVELDDCLFNIWKYKNKIDQLRSIKTNLLCRFPFIKKYDSLGNHYSEKLCYYCNYRIKKLCECNGKCTYTDKNGNKFTEDDDLDQDQAFDQWQEQDRHDIF